MINIAEFLDWLQSVSILTVIVLFGIFIGYLWRDEQIRHNGAKINHEQKRDK
jgi:hypothetical protein